MPNANTCGSARLPVWRSVAEAYGTTFGNLLTLIRMAWLWVIILLILVCGVFWFIHPLQEDIRDTASIGFSFSVPVFIASAIAVSWHRFVLLGEQANLASAIRVDLTVWRYFAWALASILVPIAMIVAVMVALPDWDLLQSTVGVLLGTHPLFELARAIAVIGILLFVCGACIYVVMRFAVMLPAIALRHSKVSLREAWVRTRGNGWRLFFGAVLTGMPLFLLSLMVGAAFLDSESREADVAANVFYEKINLLGGMLGVTFLSIAYRHLFSDRMTSGEGGESEPHV